MSNVSKSLQEVIKELRATLNSAYKLAPFAAILLLIISLCVVVIAVQSAATKIAIVLLIVFFVFIIVHASTNSYGEAALALSAGLFSVYSVEWSTANFISFVAVWVGFSLLVFLISSVQLAARNEFIYKDASLILARTPSESSQAQKKLKQIDGESGVKSLGPIERAKVLRVFCIRQLPLDVMKSALKDVETLSIITQAEPERVGRFVADSYKVFDAIDPENVSQIIEVLFQAIRSSAVPPDDFLTGFESSRHLVLSRTLTPQDYLNRLRIALENGISPDNIGEHLESTWLT